MGEFLPLLRPEATVGARSLSPHPAKLVAMAGNIEQVVLRIAARSAGVCTRVELIEAGVARRTITARVAAGSLVRVGAGVFEVPALVTEETPLFRAARAHPSGALSHHTAARLWSLPVAPVGPEDLVELTVPRPTGTRAGVAGVALHRVRRWTDVDVAEAIPGLPTTSPARTIVDLSGTAIGDRRLRHVVQVSLASGLVSLAEVARCLDRLGGRGVTGSGRLRHLLSGLDDGQPVPQSVLEWRLTELVDDRFQRQFRPPWYDGIRGVVDLADPRSRTIVEADGRRWHAVEQAMAEDRRRDRKAAANGWLVLRVTWQDVVHRPAATAADIGATLAARSRSAA